MGEVSSVRVNLKANSFSVISRRLYYQVIRGVTCQRYNSSEVQLIRGKDIENYLQNSKVDTTVDRVRSKSKEDRAFALKLNNHFCPMTIDCSKLV